MSDAWKHYEEASSKFVTAKLLEIQADYWRKKAFRFVLYQLALTGFAFLFLFMDNVSLFWATIFTQWAILVYDHTMGPSKHWREIDKESGRLLKEINDHLGQIEDLP